VETTANTLLRHILHLKEAFLKLGIKVCYKCTKLDTLPSHNSQCRQTAKSPCLWINCSPSPSPRGVQQVRFSECISARGHQNGHHNICCSCQIKGLLNRLTANKSLYEQSSLSFSTTASQCERNQD